MKLCKIYGIIKDVAVKKRSVKYILNNFKIKNCTKDIFNKVNKIIKNNYLYIVKNLIIISAILFGITIGSYRPIYEVYVDGESLGYVTSRKNLEEKIKEEILTINDSNAVAIDLNKKPTYKYKLARLKETNEEDIIKILSSDITTTYRLYAININNDAKAYVNSWEEAEKIVDDMKTEYEDSVEAEITVTEKYTEDLDIIKVEELAEAEASINNNLRSIKAEQDRIAQSTFNGIYFSVKPVVGTITSRFGAVESIRDHAHQGMDIAAPNGTSIKAAAPGKIIQAGYYGGYGKLIIIDHGNGVSTYYGHCSKLNVSVGESVEAGDIIGAVGSTGNSTGNHLHFEIRLNGSQINPENYIYR